MPFWDFFAWFFWFYIGVACLWIFIYVFIDVFRDDILSGWYAVDLGSDESIIRSG